MVQELKMSYPRYIEDRLSKTISSLLPSSEKDGELYRIRASVETIFLVAHIYGLKFPEPDHEGDWGKKLGASMCNMAERICKVQLENGNSGWVKYFKYKICAYFANYHQQKLPPAPAGLGKDRPEKLFAGAAGEWLRSFLRFGSDRTKKAFVESILMAKKGAPAVSKETVDAAEKLMKRNLTTKRPIDFWNYDRNIVKKNREVLPLISDSNRIWCPMGFKSLIPMRFGTVVLENELRRTVRECFKKKQIENWAEFRFMSTSANYNRGRKDGGQVFEYRDLLVPSSIDLLSFSNTCKVQMVGPYSAHGGELGREENRSIEKSIMEGAHTEETYDIHVLDGRALRERFEMDYQRLKMAGFEEDPWVSPIGLPEPLKVRVISKGPPLKYATMKPVQKFLWKTLSKIKSFELIGRPVNQEDIDVVARFDNVISGDYKSSTDNMHSWVTETLWDEICIVCKFDWVIRDIGLKCLTKHLFKMDLLSETEDGKRRIKEIGELKALKKRITKRWESCVLNPLLTDREIKEKEYNEQIHMLDAEIAFEGDVGSVEQVEGQLMGSIISFPLLCLANAAICRLALERTDRRTWKLNDRRIPLRVNGDDCLLSSNDPWLEVHHEALAADVGWELSVGKSYVSRNLAVINSEAYYRDDWPGNGYLENPDTCDRSYGPWYKTGYVNLGLLKGQSKDGSQKKDAYQLGGLHQLLVYHTPPEQLKAAHSFFIQYHKNELERAQIPWFMPQWLGGLGLHPVNGERNDFDRSVATLIRSSYDNRFRIQTGSESEWQMDKLAKKKLKGITPVCFRAFRFGSESHAVDEENQCYSLLQEEYDRAYGALVCNTLYSSTEEELRKTYAIDDSGKKRIRRNRAVWNKARKECREKGVFLKPLSDDDLDCEFAKPIYPIYLETGIEQEDPTWNWDLSEDMY